MGSCCEGILSLWYVTSGKQVKKRHGLCESAAGWLENSTGEEAKAILERKAENAFPEVRKYDCPVQDPGEVFI